MNCPACGRQGTVQWTPPTYSCCRCKHVLTKREYESAIRGGQLGDDVARIGELEDEAERLREAARLVVAQFAGIADSSWPTRGMKQAIERLEG